MEKVNNLNKLENELRIGKSLVIALFTLLFCFTLEEKEGKKDK